MLSEHADDWMLNELALFLNVVVASLLLLQKTKTN